LIYAAIAQNTPQSDPLGRTYPDMPTAADIGDFSNPTNRESIVRVGGSTVKVNSSKYEIVDLVTTSHPDDEPQTAVLFRWVRDLVGVDWNMKYMYTLLYDIYVKGKTLISDASISSAADTISPKRFKGVLNTQYFPVAEDKGLIVDQAFSKASLQVQIGESNPNRLEAAFGTKRSGTARVGSTTNETQFNFGG